ncbi:V-type ATP synthase subunit I [Legionella birminghamensis]|uniref:V-type ATP synthase subunit I n=1 Tax=Legionella birminghamensis TaxID=28083 RepID=A0A378IB22_9GAMM|nr:V-type ATPase 116kDa subunit family protein [Legionella birminghamensis]KTC75960.1 V-type ATP synthase subunit I [Legionella birminghamensis]STX32086.1 V-type ATP synthase subunit I [Legionella birminghamensis]
MSIVSFKKLTVLASNRNKNQVIDKLQALGCMHLISLKPQDKSALTRISTSLLEEINSALRYLKDSPEQGRQRLQWKQFNPDEIVKCILSNQKQMKEYVDKRDFLMSRIHQLSEWGNFQLPEKTGLAGIKLWFYKLSYKEAAMIPNDKVVQEVYRNNRFIFLVILAREEPQGEAFCSRRIHTGAIPLNGLYSELEAVNEQIDELVDERRNLTRYRFLLSQEIARFTDRSQFNNALEKVSDNHNFFLLQGWVPQSQIDAMCSFCKAEKLGLTIEDPKAGELPPTLLETYSWMDGGQKLVNFYQTPGYHSLDPSVMVFFSFSVFFAMILADAGYGIILAVLTLFSWKNLGKRNSLAWLRPLLLTICIFSIIYGVLLGSYWGLEPKAGSLLARLKIIDIQNFKSMMTLVIVIGCLHICIASGMRAWFAQDVSERIKAIGIILFIIAALVWGYGLMNHNNGIAKGGISLLIISLIIMLFFASNEPVKGFKSLMLRGFHGLAALMELPSLFGDILSYLRLFALGLAGASLALTFNTMASHIAESSWLLAGLVLVLGQTLNFVLCLMGALIHGLRLNYIEFFKWSVKEDGYNYQPFKKQEISHE